MRAIKFRAWDKEGLYTDESKPGMLEEIEGKIYWDCVFYDDDFPIMQFTGLKDKAGKEIYEGDIVKFIQLDGKEYFGIIQWNEKEIKFYPKAIRGEGFYDYMGRNFSWDELEVIGNIYENPELIKNG